MKTHTQPFMTSALKRGLLILILFTSGYQGMAFGQDIPLKALNSPQEILDTLDREGVVRVMVEFSNPQTTLINPRRLDRVGDLVQHKEAIKNVQSRILGRVFKPSGVLHPHGEPRHHLRALEISPLLAMTVNAQELLELSQDPEVIKIHPDRQGFAQLQNSVPLIGMTGATGAYSQGATGSGQTVAILDTGIQSNHPFLSGKVVAESCFSGGGNPDLSLCPNGQISQEGPGSADAVTPRCMFGGQVFCEHGTHVAGIAAGLNPLPTIPPNGVAKAANIISIQVFSAPPGCNTTGCLTYMDSDVIAALEWLYSKIVNQATAAAPLAAINMSFGGGVNSLPCDTDPMQPMIEKFKALGVSTVAASGNSGLTNALMPPACIPGVVAVGSSTITNQLSFFSNQSPMVSLLAPGTSIFSSIPISTYATLSGTSMATPHVAGAIAAIKSLYPSAGVDRVVGALRMTGVPVAGVQPKPRISVAEAVKAMAQPWTSVDIKAEGAGLIVSRPDGLYCTSHCSADFLSSTALTLSATPLRGNRFDGWTGDCSASTVDCDLPLGGAAKFVRAKFVPIFNVGVRITGQGTVKSQPGGIDCGATCQATLDVGTKVQLTASPSPGYAFKAWHGDCEGSSPLCQISGATSDVYITAEFIQTQTLSINRTGAGLISSDPLGIQCGVQCSAVFPKSTQVSLTATADLGWRFTGWGNACSGLGVCQTTLTGDQTIAASFMELPTYPLTVFRPAHGSITSAPGSINCGEKGRLCSGVFSDVVLTATAQPGFVFKAWIGCPSQGDQCATTLTSETRISAQFERLPRYMVSIKKNRGGSIASLPKGLACQSRSIQCRTTFLSGTHLLLTATPDLGRHFMGWGGACSGSGVTCDLSITSITNVTAQFQ